MSYSGICAVTVQFKRAGIKHSHKGSGTPQALATSAYSFLLRHLTTRKDQFLFLCPIMLVLYYIIKPVKSMHNTSMAFTMCLVQVHREITVVLLQQSRGSMCLCLKWSKLGENCLILKIQMACFWRLEQSPQGSWLQHSSKPCQEKCSCKITK